jgi:hypothetical protein
VYRILEDGGHDVFYGPDVEPGDTGFKATWTGELLRREVCVCFISPEYLTPFCLEECAIAKAAKSVKRYVVLLCPKEVILPLLENIVKKGTIPLAADLYTDLATEAVQFVCIGEKDPAKIADRLEKIFVAITAKCGRPPVAKKLRQIQSSKEQASTEDKALADEIVVKQSTVAIQEQV